MVPSNQNFNLHDEYDIAETEIVEARRIEDILITSPEDLDLPNTSARIADNIHSVSNDNISDSYLNNNSSYHNNIQTNSFPFSTDMNTNTTATNNTSTGFISRNKLRPNYNHAAVSRCNDMIDIELHRILQSSSHSNNSSSCSSNSNYRGNVRSSHISSSSNSNSSSYNNNNNNSSSTSAVQAYIVHNHIE